MGNLVRRIRCDLEFIHVTSRNIGDLGARHGRFAIVLTGDGFGPPMGAALCPREICDVPGAATVPRTLFWKACGALRRAHPVPCRDLVVTFGHVLRSP